MKKTIAFITALLVTASYGNAVFAAENDSPAETEVSQTEAVSEEKDEASEGQNGDSDFLNKLHTTEKLDGAVKAAKELTAKGKSCVLSPAAASYNDFKNFEERGNAFRKLVFSK